MGEKAIVLVRTWRLPECVHVNRYYFVQVQATSKELRERLRKREREIYIPIPRWLKGHSSQVQLSHRGLLSENMNQYIY